MFHYVQTSSNFFNCGCTKELARIRHYDLIFIFLVMAPRACGRVHWGDQFGDCAPHFGCGILQLESFPCGRGMLDVGVDPSAQPAPL